jgi:hypothetical protein
MISYLGNFRYFDILIINVVLNLKLKLSEQIEWNPGKSLKNIDNIMESRISAHLFLPIIYRRINLILLPWPKQMCCATHLLLYYLLNNHTCFIKIGGGYLCKSYMSLHLIDK